MDDLTATVFGLRNLPQWRKRLVFLTQKWYFTGTVYVAILYSAGSLAWPYVTWPDLAPYTDFDLDPQSQDPTLPFYLVSDVMVLLVFTVEAVVKLLAWGSGLQNLIRKKKENYDTEEEEGHDISDSTLNPEKRELHPEEEQAVRDIFQLFDIDNSGAINQLELRLAMRGLGFDESEEDLKRMFEEMDTDGNQEVDFEEFKEVLAYKIFNMPQPPGYFQMRWNQFDFTILAVSWCVLPFQYTFSDAQRVGDIARLLRVARLWEALESQKLRVVKDVILVFSSSFFSSVQLFTLIVSILVLYSTMGLALYSDGGMNGKCIVSSENALALNWNVSRLKKQSTIGELQQPLRYCGNTPCESGAFICACQSSNNVLEYSGPEANLGCGRIPLGKFGDLSGPHPVTADFGFLGFNNFLQAFLTSFVGITESKWTRILFDIMYAYNSPSAFLFFVSLFVFGRLWVVNLFTASVASSYSEISSERKIREKREANAIAERRLVHKLRARRNDQQGDAGSFSLRIKATSIAILERLGDLKDASPRDLSARIHAAFARFDTNRSGRVDRQNLEMMLKILGVNVSEEQLQQWISGHTQRVKDKYMDEEDFEELVKSIVAQCRREARDAEREAASALQDEEPFKLFGFIPMSRKLLEPNTVPKDKWSLAVAKLLAYPNTLDECGECVPYDIIWQAERRNLVLQFGPLVGQWSVFAGNGGASIGINVGKGRQNQNDTLVKELFPSLHAIPGGEGLSVDSNREDMITFMLDFDIHTRYLNYESSEPPKSMMLGFQAYSEIVAVLLILASTIVLCCVHFDGTVDMSCQDPSQCPNHLVIMSRDWQTAFYVFEVLFNAAFTLEAVLKIIALGFDRYIIRLKNRFDLAVAVICDVGLLMFFLIDSRSQISFIRLIRLLRVLQMVSLLENLLHWETVYRKCLSGLSGQLPIFCLLVFSISLAAIIGMNSFACDPKPLVCAGSSMASAACSSNANATCGRSPLCPMYMNCPFTLEQNFNSFSDAFNLVFMIAVSKGWEDPMFAAMRRWSSPIYGLVFFIGAYCFFNYFVVNVFFAIVLDGFNSTDEMKEIEQVEIFHQGIVELLDADEKEPLQEYSRGMDVMKKALGEQGTGSILWFAKRRLESSALDTEVYKTLGFLPPPTPNAINPEEPRNIRGFARDLMESKTWVNLILVTIMVSSLLLSLESPLSDVSAIKFLDRRIGSSVSITLTIFCFMVFFVEMILKILVLGLIWENRKAYLRQFWNLVDFIIVLAFLLEFAGLSNLIVFRILRSLRLTRLVRLGPVQLLQNALTNALKDLRTLFFFGIFIFIVSSLMAQSFFYGTLNYCTDSDQGLRATALSTSCDASKVNEYPCDWVTGKILAPAITMRVECIGVSYDYRNSVGQQFVFDGDGTDIMRPRAWAAPRYSFDNFGESLQSLIEVFAVDEWVDVAASAASGVGIGRSPIPKQQAAAWVFFIAFLVIIRLSFLPLVLGVLMNHLSRIQGTATTTSLQENWTRFVERVKRTKPIVPITLPHSAFRRHIFVFVNNKNFKRLSNSVIVLNVIFLASDYYDESNYWKQILFWMNVAFVTIYVIEIGCKLIAYALPFFEDPWNLFDLFVVAFGVLELCNIPGLGFPAVLVFRVVKCFRIVRFLRGIAELQLMFKVLSKSSRLVFGSLLLIVVYMFFFAVVGCQIFAGVKRGRGITNDFNMDTTLNAFEVLFVIATGRGFGAVLRDTLVRAPACTSCYSCVVDQYGELVDFDDCGAPGSQAFFDIYIILAHAIFMQIIVAVVVNQYLLSVSETKFVLQNEHLQSFCRRWYELDPKGTARISTWNLRTLLERLHLDGNPLGSCALCDEFNHRSVRIEILDGQDDHTYFDFHKTLHTLSLCVAGAKALPYGDMMKRREKLAFYAKAAILSKAALLYGKHRHAHNVQGNLIAQRKLDDSDHAVENKERTTFCFHLLSGERMVILDANSASILIQRGARCDVLEACFSVHDLAELRCKAQGYDANLVHMRTAEGQHFVADFFDRVQAMRFASLVRTLRKVTGEEGEEHLETLRRQQVEGGISPDRDPIDALNLRFIAATVEGELQSALQAVHDRHQKVD